MVRRTVARTSGSARTVGYLSGLPQASRSISRPTGRAMLGSYCSQGAIATDPHGITINGGGDSSTAELRRPSSEPGSSSSSTSVSFDDNGPTATPGSSETLGTAWALMTSSSSAISAQSPNAATASTAYVLPVIT